ncbi:YbaB/EbfC family nucleoid-associated protein [Streptomyces sp. NPDC087532]|uniref:YbaB/EbfC family nucleoid-associated protein n=1 Tax=Streptomyces sp. NPDC087532 TaxID=3365795 RepID=UPI00381D56B2
MSSGYQEQLDQIMGQLAEHSNRLLETQQRLAKETVKVTSKDRSITVVMGTQANVREIKFHDDTYRSKAPAELGRVLVELLERARAEAAEKVNAAVAPMAGFGEELRGSLIGGTDQHRMMNEVRQQMWPQGGPGAGHGRRTAGEDEGDD